MYYSQQDLLWYTVANLALPPLGCTLTGGHGFHGERANRPHCVQRFSQNQGHVLLFAAVGLIELPGIASKRARWAYALYFALIAGKREVWRNGRPHDFRQLAMFDKNAPGFGAIMQESRIEDLLQDRGTPLRGLQLEIQISEAENLRKNCTCGPVWIGM
jgi:hypothetical protein